MAWRDGQEQRFRELEGRHGVTYAKSGQTCPSLSKKGNGQAVHNSRVPGSSEGKGGGGGVWVNGKERLDN